MTPETDEKIVQNLPYKMSIVDKKRLQFLRKGVFIGIAAELSFLFAKDIRAGVLFPLIVDMFVLISLFTIYTLSFHVKNHKPLYHMISFVISSATLISMYTTSAERAVFLTPLGILVAFLLLSRKGGIIWFAYIYIGLIVEVIFHRTGFLETQIGYRQLGLSMILVMIITASLYVYEGINLSNEKLIADRDDELTELNEKLKQQLEKNKQTSEELAQNLQISQKSNQTLKDTKLAIMNILEDSNSLQEQLVEEKNNVEKTVRTRTRELRHEQARLRASINSLDLGFLMVFKSKQADIYNPALIKILDLHAYENEADNLLVKVQKKIGKAFDLHGAVVKSLDIAKPFSVKNIEVAGKFIKITGAPIKMKGEEEVIGCVVIVEDKTESIILERSKDEFISIASHELRTPLTAIKGNTVMLEMMYGKELKNKDIKDIIADIKDSSVRLIGIVNQFLSTSRLEQKRTVFDMNPINIGEKIKESVKNLQGLADDKKLELKIEIPEKLPNVLADESRLQEVLVNMIGNSIKYTEKGHVKISASVVNKFVEIEVEDTGVGIDPINHKLLFHKFQQATSDILTREDSRSTGLGLYVTKLLVEQMGGCIGLKQSEIGKGSVFSFKLPIAKKDKSN